MTHELRHAWQKLVHREVFDDVLQAEGDAYPYAYQALIRYLVYREQITPSLRSEIEATEAGKRAQYFRTWPNGRFELI